MTTDRKEPARLTNRIKPCKMEQVGQAGSAKLLPINCNNNYNPIAITNNSVGWNLQFRPILNLTPTIHHLKGIFTNKVNGDREATILLRLMKNAKVLSFFTTMRNLTTKAKRNLITEALSAMSSAKLIPPNFLHQ